jgi:general stress protein YciG
MSEGKRPRGLAAMTPQRRAEIASMGGRAVPGAKRAFSDKKLARAAGKRGGLRVVKKTRLKGESNVDTKLV